MKKIILVLIAMLLALSCACSVNNTTVDNLSSNSANNTVVDNSTSNSTNSTAVDSSRSNSTNNTAASSTTVESSQNSSENSSTSNDNAKASFEIYLVKNLINCDASKIDLSKLELEEKPLLTDKDISEYVWKSHQIKLIKDGELKKTLNEKVYRKTPVTGKPFVVVCNGEKVYCGAFWTLLSSLYFPDLPIIISDYTDRDYFEIEFSGEIDSKTMEVKNDVRNDKRIYDTFKKLGKLK